MARPFLTLFKRPAKQKTVRRFDGAAGGRRGWGMGSFGRINSEVAGANASLRSRARYLATNNPWITQAVGNWAGSLIGPGINPIRNQPQSID